jgi:hypothetical protein
MFFLCFHCCLHSVYVFSFALSCCGFHFCRWFHVSYSYVLLPIFFVCLVPDSHHHVLPRTLHLGLSLYISFLFFPVVSADSTLHAGSIRSSHVKGSIFRIFLGYSTVAFGSDFAASIFPPLSFVPYMYVLCFV